MFFPTRSGGIVKSRLWSGLEIVLSHSVLGKEFMSFLINSWPSFVLEDNPPISECLLYAARCVISKALYVAVVRSDVQYW